MAGMRRLRGGLITTVIAAGLLFSGTALAQGSPSAATRSEAAVTARVVRVTPAATGTTATAQLATLTVKGRSPKTGYARVADFGPAWADVDRNGCDTRDDVLRRDLTGVRSSGCTVLSGVLHDPYTGRTIDFARGASTSAAVQIDHVVSLSDAWQTGAQKLTAAQRQDLANDPLNLFAVDGPTNEAKGDGDTATWLPKNKAFRCTYVAHQVAVKATYRLWVTSAEHAAMARVLSTCGALRAPVSTLAGGHPVAATPGPTAKPRPASPSASAVPRPSATAAPAPRSSESTAPTPSATASDPAASAPAGATAVCRDGTYSYSQTRSGTCSRHGGVAEWL